MHDLYTILITASPAIAAGLVGFVVNLLYRTKKEILARLDRTVSEEKVIQLIEYRFGPVSEDIREIKRNVDRINDKLVEALLQKHGK